MMNDKERQKLEVERAIGDQHQRAWENTIQPFFDNKMKELFDAFLTCDSGNKSMLFDLKLQLNALQSLEVHFKSFIETGKMASQTLNEGEENGDR